MAQNLGTYLINERLSNHGASASDLQSQAYNAFEAQKSRDFTASENALNREFNSAQALLDRQFQAEQAQISRDFEERLSNTAYQRMVVDLRNAGLNPYLAYSQGGASTPVVSTPSGVSASYGSSGSSASARTSASNTQLSYFNSALSLAKSIALMAVLKK